LASFLWGTFSPRVFLRQKSASAIALDFARREKGKKDPEHSPDSTPHRLTSLRKIVGTERNGTHAIPVTCFENQGWLRRDPFARRTHFLKRIAVKPKYSPTQQARLEAISAQLQNADSSLSELSKDALRKEALQIHRDVETREQLRIEQKAAAKKERAEAKAKAAKHIADSPAKPTLEECHGDADVFRKEVELWQLCLDERAAQKILDSPRSSLPYRDSANRTLRQCAQRRHELYPDYYGPNGARLLRKQSPVNSPKEGGNVIADERSYAEREPFEGYLERYPKSLTWGDEYHSWQVKCEFMDYVCAMLKLQRENPAEYERQQQAIREAEAQRLADFVSINCLGQVIGRGNRKSTIPTNPDGSYIASPLQKKAWGEQSREFSRLRGEIVDPPVALVVESPDRSTAFRLTLDGFLFWADNTPCQSPLPAGTRVISAPTPPLYHQHDNQIPAGWKFDPINFVWVTTR
jgi:hypothetical protein